jgi:hypothetical protein
MTLTSLVLCMALSPFTLSAVEPLEVKPCGTICSALGEIQNQAFEDIQVGRIHLNLLKSSRAWVVWAPGFETEFVYYKPTERDIYLGVPAHRAMFLMSLRF